MNAQWYLGSKLLLFVTLHCVLLSDAGARVTEEAHVEQQVASRWSNYNFPQVVLRMVVVADSSSDEQLSVAVFGVIVIQVVGFAILCPMGPECMHSVSSLRWKSLCYQQEWL